MAATLKNQIYEEDIYATIALRVNLAANTEVHGNEPAKVYYKILQMRYENVTDPTFADYLNRVNDENNKIRDTVLFFPDYCILHRFAGELRQIYTTRPSDAVHTCEPVLKA